MIILKLGGSVVTDKSVPSSLRESVVRRLAQEIKEAGVEVVVVHGGGSFGHPVASEYGLQNGLSDEGQIIGVAKTRTAMEDLNRRIVELFVSEDVPAVSVQTSAVFKCEHKRILSAYIESIKDFLGFGMVPVLYGDVVPDTALGVCILSGDQIVTYLARTMGVGKVVLATNVSGVLDRNGHVIDKINNENVSLIEYTEAVEDDVTGGMKGKVEELLNLTGVGVSAIVVNALEAGIVKNALLGKSVKGTLFEA
jgi:isopentenyl phosphate kinase